MKFIFNRLPPARFYCRWRLSELFVAWIRSRDVYLADSLGECSVEYNDCYHFYDINLFERHGDQNPAEHIHKTLAVLQSEGIKLKFHERTWRWERTVENESIYIPGVRIWVDAI